MLKRILTRFMRFFGYITKEEEAAIVREAMEVVRGERCHICRQKYIGLAMDCKCTNWGKS
jgi:hypothetical protein